MTLKVNFFPDTRHFEHSASNRDGSGIENVRHPCSYPGFQTWMSALFLVVPPRRSGGQYVQVSGFFVLNIPQVVRV
jgi:hypothetical protein